MNIVALILAAGEGRRMGVAKAILKIGDRFLADIQYETLYSCGIDEIRIIIGASSEDIMCKLLHRQSCIVNPNYNLGQFSSLISGIRAFGDYDGILVMPVDNFPTDRDVIKDIIAGFDKRFDATVPTYRGRKGHPPILSKGFADLLDRRDIANSRLDLLLREANIKLIEVRSESIHNNLNYPLH